MNHFLTDIKTKPIFWLVLFVPVLLVLEYTHAASPTVIFVLSVLAIVPLAAFLSAATEGIAAKTGDTIGGLLNATLGNLTELVIFIAALQKGLIELVKAAVVGGIVTNSLFMMGMSYLLGGLRHKVQTFNRPNAFIQSSLLFIVCISLMVPTILSKVSSQHDPSVLSNISIGIAILLMILYILSLVFSLKTHANFFKSSEENKHDEAEAWPVKTSLVVLAISAICIAVVSEIFVESVQEVSTKMGLSQAFVGFIIVPIVGAAAEMMAAFKAAKKDKLDISVSIAMGSSVQIALFITPLLIMLSYFIAPSPMNLDFKGGLIFMILFGTLTVSLTCNHGKSTWYLGVLLLSAYLIFGIALFFLP